MHLLLTLILTGCRGTATGPDACAAMQPGRQRDECWRDQVELLPVDQAGRLPELVQPIADPVIRDAAVLSWLEQHGQAISPDQAEATCDLLDESRAHMCRRRLQSAHLQK